jgi:hypothetical protein
MYGLEIWLYLQHFSMACHTAKMTLKRDQGVGRWFSYVGLNLCCSGAFGGG